MKKRLTFFACMCAALFYLAACSNEQTDTTKTDTTAILLPVPLNDTAAVTKDTTAAQPPGDTTVTAGKTPVPAPGKIRIVLDNKKETEPGLEPRVKKVSRKGRIVLEALKANPDDKIEADKDGVYSRAAVMPVYPGGQNALRDYIENRIQYPENALDNNIGGTVLVSFVVDEQGKILSPTVLSPKLGYGLEEEAIRIVKQMRKWSPGQVDGTAVKTRMRLPITYRAE